MEPTMKCTFGAEREETMNKEGLMNYIKEEFPGVIDSHWNWELLENIIDFGIENKNYSVGQLMNFLDEMIPEVTLEEIERFI